MDWRYSFLSTGFSLWMLEPVNGKCFIIVNPIYFRVSRYEDIGRHSVSWEAKEDTAFTARRVDLYQTGYAGGPKTRWAIAQKAVKQLPYCER